MEISKEEIAMTDKKEIIIISEGIHLKKLSKGNYTWEIKIAELDPDKIMKLNDEMFQRFGGSNGEA